MTRRRRGRRLTDHDDAARRAAYRRLAFIRKRAFAVALGEAPAIADDLDGRDARRVDGRCNGGEIAEVERRCQ
eukprot:3403995-Prymnesium_polylepis.2